MERKKASDFPQELLDLLDQYVHGGISRRQFKPNLQRVRITTAGGTNMRTAWLTLRPLRDSSSTASSRLVESEPSGE